MVESGGSHVASCCLLAPLNAFCPHRRHEGEHEPSTAHITVADWTFKSYAKSEVVVTGNMYLLRDFLEEKKYFIYFFLPE